jgi:hypothetical protein
MTKYMITWNHDKPEKEVCNICDSCVPDGCGYTEEQAKEILKKEEGKGQ